MSVPQASAAGELRMMREYIEKNCGIHLPEEKNYLVESRLTVIMAENGCATFGQLHAKAVAETTQKLRERIVDAMTTNETLWFRDGGPFAIVGGFLQERLAAAGRGKLRVWSAACSTGQEPYSVAITVLEQARKNHSILPENVEIVATDISPTVLYLAQEGRYDPIAMSRGMPQDIRDRYFEQSGRVWKLRDEVRRMVRFVRLNLAESYASLGTFDLVMCRNVLIYFAEPFKRDIIQRIAGSLRPQGWFLLGASESLMPYSTAFDMNRNGHGIYYTLKHGKDPV